MAGENLNLCATVFPKTSPQNIKFMLVIAVTRCLVNKDERE